ncbi:uncharacterized protein LOC143285542 isoform X2 [Babylonia areolata]|uniref:uncharacterized protein LOC143285542 isoform X2 n=1 Tax=Babylonia areolata TaxID=304850 RepID=UPI003FD678EC
METNNTETSPDAAADDGKTWRTRVPDGLQTFWDHVSSGPKQCKAKVKAKGEAKDGKDKAHTGVGKEIGLLYGGSLILNTIIGPGIFTSPKGVLAGAGSVGMSLVIWGVCGVFSTMAALCFAELRESVRKDGVEYAYITEAFGPLAGFVYCWMRIAAAEPVGTAVFAAALADYIADTIYDDCGSPELLRKSIAILAVVSLALLNVFSQKLADRMQVLAYVGKITAIGVIIFYGLKHIVEGKTEELQQPFEGTISNPTSLTFAFYNGLWAYGGWSNVNHVTSGLKKPPRNLPRLVKTVIPLVMVIYMLVVTSYFTVMSREEMLASEAIGVTWAERVLKDEAMAIIPIGVGLTALGSLNGTFLSAGRLSGVAVKDKQMPEVASWIHVRSKTPILTVYTRLVIATIMILVAEIGELVRFFIFSVWLFHGMSVLALLVLRFKDKDKVRPYKVNIVLPVIVVLVIAFLLIGPFLETPKPEFISSLALIVLSLLCYLPSRWIQSRASVPDRMVVWLQLFFRIAPKRDLRRKSFLRRMSSLARNSILIPAGASPAAIRRLQGSPNLLRRVSRVSQMSPSLYRRNLSSPAIFRRVQRHRSAAEADLKRGRSGSRVAWLETGQGGSPALVRRRSSRQAQSFGAGTGGQRSRMMSVPNVKFYINSDACTESSTDPLALTSASKTVFNDVTNPNRLAVPNGSPGANSKRLAVSGNGTAGVLNVPGTSGTTTTSGRPSAGSTFTTAAAISVPSPSGSPVISTATLPAGVRSGSLNNIFSEEVGTSSGVDPGSGGYLNKGYNNGSTQSLPINILPSAPSPIPEESFQEGSPPDNVSGQGSEGSLTLVGEYESEDGGQYEILALPALPLARDRQSGSDSDDSSTTSSDDTFRGFGSLFDSSTDMRSDSSDSSDSTDDEGSDRHGGYVSDYLDSEMDEIIFANLDDRTATYI